MAPRYLVLALAYFVSGWLGLQIPYAGSHITLVWLPTGLAVAGFYRWGGRMWPAVYGAAFLVNLSVGSSPWLAAGIAVGNTLAPWMAAHALHRIGFDGQFAQRRQVLRFLIVACLGMLVSASGGVISLHLAALLPMAAMPSAWLSWWMGDTVGVLLAAPVLLMYARLPWSTLCGDRREGLLWLLIACLVGWFAFWHNYASANRSLPIAFLTLPLVAWAAMRFHRLGAALAGFGFSLLAAVGTGLGHGTFYLGDVQVGQFLLWSYMGVTMLTGLMIGAMHTEREMVEVTLRQSQERLNEAQQVALLGNYEWDVVHDRLWWSDQHWRLWGIEPRPDQLPDAALYQHGIHPDDFEQAQATVKHAIKERASFVSEYRVVWPDGSVHDIRSIGRVLVDAQGKVSRMIGTVQDITERRIAEQKIQWLAFYDELTKLPNRRLASDRLGQALVASQRSRERGAIMMLDLDNFKTLNDTQGHDAGDRLLVEAASRIKGCVRQQDTVARFGGDEFVVLIEGLDTDEAAAAAHAEGVAEKIRVAFDAPFNTSGGERGFRTTCSIGVALFSGQAQPMDELLKQADVALYQAKGAGRNTVRFFSPEMQALIESYSAMEAAMHLGLQNREFRLFYQPQLDQAGKLIGAEALLRWFPHGQHPVSPAQFIPLAEETGLIVPIGLWVIQAACAQLQAWAAHAQTSELVLAINVSARQFRQPDFVKTVRDSLQHHGVNPARLKIELTESVVLDNIDEVIARMRQIKALGVTFALDDFGTGFSSLSYLKRLPLDQVKIDQSFVRDVTSDPSDAAIVSAIVAMSRSLGMQVIAEGVETPDQLAFLSEQGCMHYQGYLFGKPMAIEEWATMDKARFASHFDAPADPAASS